MKKISAKRPEAIIEDYFIKKAKAHKFMQFKFLSGITGVPDRILIGQNQVTFVELKAKHGVLSARQTRVINQIRKHGVSVFIPCSKEDVDNMFDIITKRKIE